MPSFASALDRSMETIKRPPPPPMGSYTARVMKMPDPAEKFEGKNGDSYERVTIQMQLLAAIEDTVDPDELEAFGKVAGAPIRHTFLFNTSDEQKFEATLNRLKNFMTICGISTDTGNFSERLAELPNCQCGVTIKHRLDPTDPMVTYGEIDQTFAL